MRRSNLPPTVLTSPDDVEAQFYEAMARGDIDQLMAVWCDDDEAACVHPNGGRLIGAASIRAGFEAVFANGAVPVRLHAVRRLSALGCAVHHVVERIDLPGAEAARTAWVLATNVYLKTAMGWRMALHHASAAVEKPQSSGEEPSTLH